MMPRAVAFLAATQLLDLIFVTPFFPFRVTAIIQNQTYDYVIVGGGLTGLVAANRLSEDNHTSVLVIENGYIDDAAITRIPFMATQINTGDMWDIKSAPEPQLNDTIWNVRVGNVVGGGSVVNGMQWDRGSDADYDAWEQLGNKGWGFDGLQEYFKKSTHFTPPSQSTIDRFGITYDESAYGHGPVQVTISSFQYPDIVSIFESWKRENIPTPEEGFANAVGAYWTPNSVDNKTATRSHARKTYYDPASSRSNLVLVVGTRVTEVIIEEKDGKLSATGVKITSRENAHSNTIHAAKDVILAAGAVFSPHLLMLSGIGPQEILSAAKIPVKLDLAGVGANLQDHVPLYMSFNLSNTAFPNPDSLANNATFNSSAAAQYEAERQGPYTFGGDNALAFLSFQQISAKWKDITAKVRRQKLAEYLPARYTKNPSLLAGFARQREVLIKLYSGNDSAIGEFPIQPSGRATVVHMKPLSRGTITLNNTKPLEAPVVQWNTIQNPVDKEVLAELARFNRRDWARAELSHFEPRETVPGARYQTDDELVIASGQLRPSFAHLSGTCAMMPKHLGGVVDSDLKVYGVESLRIIDASILPLIPSTHLQATMYAVAEKAADIIKG